MIGQTPSNQSGRRPLHQGPGSLPLPVPSTEGWEITETALFQARRLRVFLGATGGDVSLSEVTVWARDANLDSSWSGILEPRSTPPDSFGPFMISDGTARQFDLLELGRTTNLYISYTYGGAGDVTIAVAKLT